MKLAKRLGIGFGVAILLFVGIGFVLPADYTVTRSITIEAKPEAIYGPVATLKEWPSWTVWNTTRFPKMSYAYSGPASGVGAISEWTDPDNGNGRMEVTKADPQQGIEYTFEIEGSQSLGAIAFEAQGEVTQVSMTMSGSFGSNPVLRYFGLIMPSMMGPEFDGTLAGLRKRVEGPGAPKEMAPAPGSTPEAQAPETTGK